MYSGIDS